MHPQRRISEYQLRQLCQTVKADISAQVPRQQITEEVIFNALLRRLWDFSAAQFRGIDPNSGATLAARQYHAIGELLFPHGILNGDLIIREELTDQLLPATQQP